MGVQDDGLPRHIWAFMLGAVFVLTGFSLMLAGKYSPNPLPELAGVMMLVAGVPVFAWSLLDDRAAGIG